VSLEEWARIAELARSGVVDQLVTMARTIADDLSTDLPLSADEEAIIGILKKRGRI
jgi:hypothetical protein